VDAIVPTYCHHLPLPCSNNQHNNLQNTLNNTSIINPTNTTSTSTTPSLRTNTPNTLNTVTARVESCLQTPYLDDILVEADRLYCDRFSGREGGQAGTNLAYYPLLQEIYERLIGPHNEHKKQNHKLSILSGHDTVIAPLLAALGVYRSNGLCIWPGYASRIVFELYKPLLPYNEDIHHLPKIELLDSSSNAIVIANKYLTSQSKLASTLIKKTILHSGINITSIIEAIESHRELFVRVIYNGKDITQYIPMCQHERIAIAKAIVDQEIPILSKSLLLLLESNFPLCSIASFHQQIQELIRPYKTVVDACHGSN